MRRGVLREYVLAKYDHMVKVPDNISLKDAACFPATGINDHEALRIIYFFMLLECLGTTAYCFLVEKAKLKKGDKVFIHGGSGAVGVMAIQLARTIVGSTGLVVATCSPAKSDIVRNLGADEVVVFLLNFVSKNKHTYCFLRS
jgi:NADPH:quinone reductase-like Zn-dependent oxidoreductase